MSTPLDLRTIPLNGRHLIEASAGTGKTYAIANLVLRVVLEEGIGIDRVLVLTFTNAATEELRERIARRLREALAALSTGDPGDDDVLRGLLEAVGRDLAQARLAEAISRLDEAAIHTIHGFCQRLLSDNAFESGISFDPEMIQDESELRRIAAEDFWRREMAAASPEQAAWMLASWPEGPASLLATLDPYLGPAPLRVLPDLGTIDSDPMASALAWRERLRMLWPEAREQVMPLLRDADRMKLTSYKLEAVDAIPADVEALLRAESFPTELPKGLSLLAPAKLAAGTKKGQTTPRHALFDLCGELDADRVAAMHRRRRARFLGRARVALMRSLEQAKQDRRVLYFDDLLSRTARVLDDAARGRALAERIRQAYPRALIDEFQDTDPLQYRIFRRVYDGHAECGLFLIGDPKQAIYAFRGADIFTYIGARRHAADQGRIWSLETNWRSASGLVRGVNALFERAHDAFVYTDSIPFEPVKSGPRADAEPLYIDGEPIALLELRWLPLSPEHCTKTGERLTAEGARALAAADCAARIAGLLAGGAEGRVTLGDESLVAGDVALLVRKHSEGVEMRAALARHGIVSVSIGNASVLDSDEAAELALVLAALNDGADEGSIRTALATAMLGWTASRIDALDKHEGAWDALLARLDDYRSVWRRQGFLPALWRLMDQEGVATNLRRLPDGERRLTNLLHLAELAQSASRQYPGIDNLLRWLQGDRAASGADQDARLLRLESDADLVRIVTLHKSKGLEFPVVCLPFPWTGFRQLEKAGPIPFHDPDDGSACLDLGSDDTDRSRACWRREQLAEDLRLLYVGLTRAKHLCLLYWGAVNTAGESAAAYLLHPNPTIDGPGDRMRGKDDTALRAELDDLMRRAPQAIQVVDADLASAGAIRPPQAAAPALSARPFSAVISDDWRLTSYSGLAGGPDRDRPDHDAVPVSPVSEPQETTGDLAAVSDGGPRTGEPAVDPVFRFPRGIRAGHCLHGIFEHLDFPSAEGAALTAGVHQGLARHGVDPVWAAAACTLVQRTLDTPLSNNAAGRGLRLRDLPAGDRLNELEFHFALDGAEPRALSRLITAYGYADPGIGGPAALRGLMKGYIDLVFRWNGRYYLADYKSNHLGDRFEDYRREALSAAMNLHRYPLQYLIYCVALHRWLRRRAPAYRYEAQFGGVYYLFLRGLHPDLGPASGVFHDRPAAELIDALDAALSPPLGQTA